MSNRTARPSIFASWMNRFAHLLFSTQYFSFHFNNCCTYIGVVRPSLPAPIAKTLDLNQLTHVTNSGNEAHEESKCYQM
ncbi:hypothetical protein PPTG_20636 [Phytophthora nicotianae INRA-310]|uniref:Uncharacterized protein n=2 Tax=Phytophthora nicotianae TaxID=4792 RepID=W2RFH4_PHYN3|nr:hypothetical protein PPTG_20636 [Phytophthora nicotianae INRA-310]ETN23419.1 hypothetical protein PPTG_20636 [Phytophthora nicotianae INRA-310]ETO86428.1 hypothetical protein F444_00031 [Phytophthora nicotianae P1976]